MILLENNCAKSYKITGTLEAGPFTDNNSFIYNFRIKNAVVESVDIHEFTPELQTFYNLAELGLPDILYTKLMEIEEFLNLTDEDVKTIKSRLDFKYPYEHLNKLPAKLSVSKLTPTVLDDMDDDAATLESFDEAKILEIEEFFEPFLK